GRRNRRGIPCRRPRWAADRGRVLRLASRAMATPTGAARLSRVAVRAPHAPSAIGGCDRTRGGTYQRGAALHRETLIGASRVAFAEAASVMRRRVWWPDIG